MEMTPSALERAGALRWTLSIALPSLRPLIGKCLHPDGMSRALPEITAGFGAGCRNAHLLMNVCKFLCLAYLFCGAILPLKSETTLAGTRHPLNLQTPPDYSTRASALTPEVAWSQIISETGATYIAIHFTKFDLGPRDYLKVSDLNGGQSYLLRERGKMQKGSFWGQHVKGEAIRLELVTMGAERGQGFEIDQYSAGAASRQAR